MRSSCRCRLQPDDVVRRLSAALSVIRLTLRGPVCDMSVYTVQNAGSDSNCMGGLFLGKSYAPRSVISVIFVRLHSKCTSLVSVTIHIGQRPARYLCRKPAPSALMTFRWQESSTHLNLLGKVQSCTYGLQANSCKLLLPTCTELRKAFCAVWDQSDESRQAVYAKLTMAAVLHVPWNLNALGPAN